MPVRPEVWWIAALAGVLSYLFTGWVRKLALARGVLDVPNERSSHVVPTPRGGGVAIVIATTFGVSALMALGAMSLELFIALTGGGLAVAVVGYLDDRHQLSPRLRLIVHFGSAVWALAWMDGLPPLRVGETVFTFGWGGYVLGALGIVWTLNLFNFMDGIDGIAGSEAVFIVCAGAVITLMQLSGVALAGEVAGPAAMVAAASCGFLLWNWPPAKIFMGDAGSGYLGYVVVTLALAAARENAVALLVWLILGGVFFVDATVTLVRRVTRGERVHEAHRSHAYQWLSRRWGSHKRVTLLALAINALWLLPCALVAAAKPQLAAWMVVVALLPIVFGVVIAGAGRREVPV
jgi:Fuc2NAc and GlcNAc transferase